MMPITMKHTSDAASSKNQSSFLRPIQMTSIDVAVTLNPSQHQNATVTPSAQGVPASEMWTYAYTLANTYAQTTFASKFHPVCGNMSVIFSLPYDNQLKWPTIEKIVELMKDSVPVFELRRRLWGLGIQQLQKELASVARTHG